MTKKQTKKDIKKGPALSIMVPVYNEENTILEILNKVTVLDIDNYEVIIVNDSSKDKSPEIINKFSKNFKKKNPSLKVINHPENRGKGAAIKSALKQAKGEYFVIQDADLEYAPKDIPPLLRKAAKGNYRVVYGSRFMGKIKNMPKPNYYANRFYNFLLRRLYDTKITDMHTCYKMVDTELLKSFKMSANGFDYATELISKLLKNNVEVHEAPISFNGRTKKEGKKIDFKDGIDCTVKLIAYRLKKDINAS